MAVSADVSRLVAVAPEYVRRMERYRWRNFACLVLDGATFSFAIALLSESTILPAFVRALTRSDLLIGLVAATYAFGHFLPQLVGAHLVTGRRRRKPVLLAVAGAERVGILAIAVTATLVGVVDNAVVLSLFFAAFAGYAVTTGLIGPAYGDLVAKALTRARGWYYGLVQLIGGVLGFLAAMLGERLLRAHGFPLGVQQCFWICFALSFLSLVFISGIREEPYPEPDPRGPLRATIARIPSVLRTDRPYARFLVARCVAALATMGVGFIVVDGLRGPLRTPDAALLAAVFVLAQAVLGFGFGLLGNYLGWKLVIVLGSACTTVGMAAALTAGTGIAPLPFYILSFVALGGTNAATIVADPNLSIEFAPTRDTGLYLGTTSTLLAPWFVCGPLVAGALATVTSYRTVFVLAGLLAAGGLLLTLRVQEPRRMVAAAPVGQPGAMP